MSYDNVYVYIKIEMRSKSRLNMSAWWKDELLEHIYLLCLCYTHTKTLLHKDNRGVAPTAHHRKIIFNRPYISFTGNFLYSLIWIYERRFLSF